MTRDRLQPAEEIFDANGRVEELECDDTFIGHMADAQRNYGKHQVSEREIDEVLSGNPVYAENTGADRRAPIVMLGPTRNGRLIVVPLEPAGRFGVWRPVTAFEANAHHRRHYEEEVANG